MADRSNGPEKDRGPEFRVTDSGARDLDLAGAIHDVNQMLAVVAGRAGLLLRRGPGADWESNLRAMELAARDAGAILARVTGGDSPVDGIEEDVPGYGANLRDAVTDAGLLMAPPGGQPWNAPGDGTWVLENEVDGDLMIALPAQMVREVLGNLLLNSLEASPGGVTVKFTGSISDGRAVLLCQDNGPGLPVAIRESMFQAGQSASGQPGRGIGLAGCQALLRRCMGDLTLADEPGSGAAFEVRLPLFNTLYGGAESMDGPDIAPDTAPNRVVLIVDDELAVRDMLADVMTELGCTVSQAKDSGEALALFEPGAFDVVFLDQTLPGMLGDELAARLREKDPAVAIVLATGWGREKTLAGANRDHVDLTAVKPLAMDKMVSMLSEGSALAARRRRTTGDQGPGDTISERDKE